jgi:hypothetical protein
MQAHNFQTEMATKCALTAALSLQKNETSHLSEAFKIILCLLILETSLSSHYQAGPVFISHHVTLLPP